MTAIVEAAIFDFSWQTAQRSHSKARESALSEPDDCENETEIRVISRLSIEDQMFDAEYYLRNTDIEKTAFCDSYPGSFISIEYDW